MLPAAAGIFYMARRSPMEKIFFSWFEGQFPEIVKCCKIVLTMFGSTYVCEAGFSAVNNIKSKKRNSLTDEWWALGKFYWGSAAVTQYQPQINRVAATLQSQILTDILW